MAVSLLDRGVHEVVVTPRVKTVGEYGETVLADGLPVAVSGCQVQPVTAEEAESLNVSATTTYRVVGRGPWPGGLVSQVSWNGRLWDQVGEARVYTNGRRTAHFDAIIQARTTAVV